MGSKLRAASCQHLRHYFLSPYVQLSVWKGLMPRKRTWPATAGDIFWRHTCAAPVQLLASGDGTRDGFETHMGCNHSCHFLW
eukprot:533879-Pelagomonas_calceolata.AAC.1